MRSRNPQPAKSGYGGMLSEPPRTMYYPSRRAAIHLAATRIHRAASCMAAVHLGHSSESERPTHSGVDARGRLVRADRRPNDDCMVPNCRRDDILRCISHDGSGRGERLDARGPGLVGYYGRGTRNRPAYEVQQVCRARSATSGSLGQELHSKQNTAFELSKRPGEHVRSSS